MFYASVTNCDEQEQLVRAGLDRMFKGHALHEVSKFGEAMKDVSLHCVQLPIGELEDVEGV